ncbi:MAG: hypothetical protein NT160_02075, partial [Actinobacteria bacterium]|nr:hypothetical protein [Actinomycetota bacterium]
LSLLGLGKVASSSNAGIGKFGNTCYSKASIAIFVELLKGRGEYALAATFRLFHLAIVDCAP